MKRYFCLFCLFISLFCSFSLFAGESSPHRVTLGVPVKQIPYMPLYLGVEKGIFAAEGLEVLIVTISPRTAIPAMVGGDLDYTTALGSAIRAKARGLPLRALMAMATKPPFYLIVSQEIRNPKELEGKAVGVQSIGGTQHLITRLTLRHLQVNPDRVTFVNTVDGPSTLAGLKSGSIKGASLFPPLNVVARRMGFRQLAYAGDFLEIAANGIVTSEKKIREERDQVKRMVRGVLQSLAYVSKHPEESIQWIMREFRLERDVAREVYEDQIKVFRLDGSLPQATVEKEISLAREVGAISEQVDPSQMVDLSLLQEAQKEIGLR